MESCCATADVSGGTDSVVECGRRGGSFKNAFSCASEPKARGVAFFTRCITANNRVFTLSGDTMNAQNALIYTLRQ